jgi:mannose-6-phosphate isomerase
MAFFKLQGVIQNYTWGGTDFIPEWLGKRPTGATCAEYWMGAHPKAPSLLIEVKEYLDEYIEKDPEKILGRPISERYGKLPFLLKILDVAQMLSIQVHPSLAQARKGYDLENGQGIAIDATNRNFKDANHKPELMVALSEFWLLHGFKPRHELLHTLKEKKEFHALIPVFEKADYRGLYEKVMTEDPSDTHAVFDPLFDRLLPLYRAGALDKSSPDYWAARGFEHFCTDSQLDKGLYSVYFFNLLHLHAGQGIYQPAGVPHAYLEGRNVEIMANSDNVLRGGLTHKHVDEKALLQHVDFKPVQTAILEGMVQESGYEWLYPSPVPDFELSRLSLTAGSSLNRKSTSFEIWVVMDGGISISDKNGKTLMLGRGESLAVTAATEYAVEAWEETSIFRAWCSA